VRRPKRHHYKYRYERCCGAYYRSVSRLGDGHQHHARREWLILSCNRSRSDGSMQPCRASGGRCYKGLSHPNGAADLALHGGRPKTSNFLYEADKEDLQGLCRSDRIESYGPEKCQYNLYCDLSILYYVCASSDTITSSGYHIG
jgi:hypothetical protein